VIEAKFVRECIMNALLRVVFLLIGLAGLGLLGYNTVITFPDVNPIDVLVITIPDMFFFLAYKTYPAETVTKPQQSYQRSEVSNYYLQLFAIRRQQ
jgi:hypothetical protein